MIAGSEHRKTSAAWTLALVAITLAPVFSGCFGPTTREVLVEGSGYTVVPWFNNTSALIDADLSPDRAILASTHVDSALRLWDLNGSALANWTIPPCPWLDGCYVRFLDGGRLLTVSGDQLRVWSPTGAPLTAPALPGGNQGVIDLAVVRGGLEVLLGLYTIVNRSYVYSSVTLDVNANLSSALALGEGLVGYVTAASADGSLVATSGSSVQFWRRPSELIGEVSGVHEVAIDASGSFAALRTIYAYQTQIPWGVKAVNLSTVPLQGRLLSGNNSYEGNGQPQKRQLSMAPGGGFVAFSETVYLSHCGAMDCGVFDESITRIVDVNNPGADRGFGPGAAFKVFLADDGSAIAITCGLAAGCGEATFTFADAHSTPPHAVTT